MKGSATPEGADNPVVQVIQDSTGDILYTVRVQGRSFQPRVYASGGYTIKVGRDKPDAASLSVTAETEAGKAGQKTITL